MPTMQLNCNVLHVEDDPNKVHDYIVDICKVQGLEQADIDKIIPDADEIKDDLKNEGSALEIIPGYWWAATLKEAVDCIDRFTTNHRVFDFVVIDRRLSNSELPDHEKAHVSNANENDINKQYLNEAFPWYSHQAAFTGDFLFLYLTLLDKIYLRNIYFFTGQDIDDNLTIEDNKDKGIIKIWYKIAQENIGNGNFLAFDNWCKEHYIMKAKSPELETKARANLIKMMSLPHAGICNQFREGLRLFDYVDSNHLPIISLKFKNNILNLLVAAKQYDATAIECKELEGLRTCLSEEMIPILIQEIPWKERKGQDGKSHCPIKDELDENGNKTKVYSYERFDKNEHKWKPSKIILKNEQNGNIIPKGVAMALEQECSFLKQKGLYLSRIANLILLIYNIQSEGIHSRLGIDTSKPLAHTYILHTCVFAFLELSRFIVNIIRDKTDKYNLC